MHDSFKIVLNFLAASNIGLLLSILIIALTAVGFLHLAIVQGLETIKIRDFLSRYRLYIFTFFVITLITMIPVGYYLTLRYLGIDNPNLRNLSTLAARLGPFASMIAFEVIYFYRKREK